VAGIRCSTEENSSFGDIGVVGDFQPVLVIDSSTNLLVGADADFPDRNPFLQQYFGLESLGNDPSQQATNQSAEMPVTLQNNI
jgi:hypothetical protein